VIEVGRRVENGPHYLYVGEKASTSEQLVGCPTSAQIPHHKISSVDRGSITLVQAEPTLIFVRNINRFTSIEDREQGIASSNVG
jgi:hypothetical protein